jgi:Flp pilus assembly pilin Flp
MRNPVSEAPGGAQDGDSWHAPCTSNAAVRNRSHLNLSENYEMNARASTPAQTGKALNQPTLGSVWGNDEGQDLAEYAILIGLIALVVIGAVTLLGGAIMTSLYQVIIDGLPFN